MTFSPAMTPDDRPPEPRDGGAGAPDRQFEELLAASLEEVLDGRTPDLARLASGDTALAARLQSALASAMKHLPSPEPVAVPLRLGRYRIESLAGEGGMGRVVVGVDESSSRRVALKYLPFPASCASVSRERFRREALALMRVQHAGVVPVIEVGDEAGIPFIAMEHVTGGSLEAMLAEVCNFDLESARSIARERLALADDHETGVARLMVAILEALGAVHSAGVVHRDLKPANVLLHADRRPILVDFGLAFDANASSLTSTGAIVGTRQYLAPELLLGSSEGTPATDLYAAGVTMFRLLTFRFPFDGRGSQQLLRAIAEANPPSLRRSNPYVSRALERVCLRALEKKPENRYATADAMAADLRAVVERRGRSWSVGATARRCGRALWLRRQVLTATLSAVALIGGAAGFAVLQVRASARQRDRDWLGAFQRGEVLREAGTVSFVPVDRHDSRQERLAREAYAECVRIDPSRVEAWLRMAHVSIYLGEPEHARAEIEEARQRGATGWYFESLDRTLTRAAGDDGLKPPEVAVEAVRAWSPLDRVAFANKLMRERKLAEAIQILLDPELLTDPRFLVPGLIASYLHRDFVINKPIYLSDKANERRLALWLYDWCLQQWPDATITRVNRAVLIRDAAVFGVKLGADPEKTLDGAVEDLAEFADAEGTVIARGACSTGYFAVRRYEEAAAQLAPFSAEELKQLWDADRISAVKTLTVDLDFERTWELMNDPSFVPWNPELGPLGRWVELWQFLLGRQALRPVDSLDFVAFARSLEHAVASEDWSYCAPKLQKLEAAASPPAEATSAPGGK